MTLKAHWDVFASDTSIGVYVSLAAAAAAAAAAAICVSNVKHKNPLGTFRGLDS
jgi:hypothetical protein